MKKTIAILIMSLFSVVAVSGCGITITDSTSGVESISTTKESEKDGEITDARFLVAKVDKHTFVLIDKKTNVQYLKVVRNAGHSGGIVVAPLYQANGKPYVSEEVTENRFTIDKLDSHTFIITDKETKVEYLKVIRNAGSDGGLSIFPLLQPNGELLTSEP